MRSLVRNQWFLIVLMFRATQLTRYYPQDEWSIRYQGHAFQHTSSSKLLNCRHFTIGFLNSIYIHTWLHSLDTHLIKYLHHFSTFGFVWTFRSIPTPSSMCVYAWLGPSNEPFSRMLLNATLVFANSNEDEDLLDDLINRPLLPDYVSPEHRPLLQRTHEMQVTNFALFLDDPHLFIIDKVTPAGAALVASFRYLDIRCLNYCHLVLRF